MPNQPHRDEAARRKRANVLRQEIRNVGEGKDPAPGHAPSPREVTDRAAREQAEKEKAKPHR